MRFTPRSEPPQNFRFVSLLTLLNLLLVALLIVLFLPVFTSPVGLPVVLPKAVTGEPLSRKDFIVSILRDNSVRLNGESIPFEQLGHLLDSRKRFVSQVLIKADHRAQVGVLVRVWDLFRQANISQVNIATNE